MFLMKLNEINTNMNQKTKIDSLYKKLSLINLSNKYQKQNSVRRTNFVNLISAS